MSKTPILNNIRIIPKDTDFLDRKVGSRGEVFYDQDNNTVRLFDGATTGGHSLAKNDLSNIDNQIFKDKANSAGISASTSVSEAPPVEPNPGELWFDTDTGILYLYYNDGTSSQWVQPVNVSVGSGGSGTSSNSFTTIAVSGQSSVVAENSADTLNLVAGPNITITTDAATDTITISAAAGEGGGSSANGFSIIGVYGGGDVTADVAGDTLTLIAGSGITLAADPDSDAITIASTVTSGVTYFSALYDATAASMTVDKFAYPAIARFEVTNSGVSAYLFNSHYTGNNPTLYVLSGTTISFNLNTTVPFLIQDATGTSYNTGLVHVSTNGVVSTGANAQGKTSGTLYWNIQRLAGGTFRYQGQSRPSMVGSIIVKDIGVI